MKNKLILIAAILLIVGCNKKKENKSELNYIAFSVPVETMIDSMKTAITLLDKMDYGNGTTSFWIDDKLHYTKKEKGFAIVALPRENSSIVPLVEPLDHENSIKLFNLINFLKTNGIDGMVKRCDGIYWFGYKQIVLNPQNDFNQSREIVYLKEPKDTCSQYICDQIILDRYKNILLLAPKSYNEPKLSMDKESIMKRTEELMKKRQPTDK